MSPILAAIIAVLVVALCIALALIVYECCKRSDRGSHNSSSSKAAVPSGGGSGGTPPSVSGGSAAATTERFLQPEMPMLVLFHDQNDDSHTEAIDLFGRLPSSMQKKTVDINDSSDPINQNSDMEKPDASDLPAMYVYDRSGNVIDRLEPATDYELMQDVYSRVYNDSMDPIVQPAAEGEEGNENTAENEEEEEGNENTAENEEEEGEGEYKIVI